MAGRLKKGTLLLEALISVAILAQVIMVGYSIMGSTTAVARLTKDKMQCLGFAQEGLEAIRNIRDYNQKQNPMVVFNNSFTLNNYYSPHHVSITPTPQSFTLTSQSPTNKETMAFDNRFKRQITLYKSPATTPDTITVDVLVTWPGGKCSANEELTDWRKP